MPKRTSVKPTQIQTGGGAIKTSFRFVPALTKRKAHKQTTKRLKKRFRIAEKERGAFHKHRLTGKDNATHVVEIIRKPIPSGGPPGRTQMIISKELKKRREKGTRQTGGSVVERRKKPFIRPSSSV